MIFEQRIDAVLTRVRALLLAKNASYGNSAMEPVRVFSRATAVEGLCVRADDKLSRLRTLGITRDGEDTILDLIGYLVLIYVAAFGGKNEVQTMRARARATRVSQPEVQSQRESNRVPGLRKTQKATQED